MLQWKRACPPAASGAQAELHTQGERHTNPPTPPPALGLSPRGDAQCVCGSLLSHHARTARLVTGEPHTGFTDLDTLGLFWEADGPCRVITLQQGCTGREVP